MTLRKTSFLFAAYALVALALAPAARAEQSVEQMLADRVLGNPDAPVTIVEYGSLVCPACAKFDIETLPKLKERYIDSGKVNFVFRDFPTGEDGRAIFAAMLARCAPPERYYGFLDVLFRSQMSWATAPDPVSALAQIGQLGGISQQNFESCMQNEQLFLGIRQQQNDAAAQHKIRSTPTFLIGEERIEWPAPFERFQEVLDPLVGAE